MKILLLACLNNTGNALGGAEKTIINLANWLARNTNHEVKLVSVDGDAKPYNINENVNYYGFKLVTGNKIKKHLKLFLYFFIVFILLYFLLCLLYLLCLLCLLIT